MSESTATPLAREGSALVMPDGWFPKHFDRIGVAGRGTMTVTRFFEPRPRIFVVDLMRKFEDGTIRIVVYAGEGARPRL